MREGDRDRWLATLWLPAAARPGVAALFALDLTLAAIPPSSTQPALGRIRLAWWREALTRLDAHPPPPQPLLRALAARVLPRAAGAELAELEDAHLDTLDGEHARAAAARGPLVFALAARLLGAVPPPGLGAAWAAGEARRAGHTLPCPAPPARAPRALRPLLALDRLGARDCAAAASPPRGTPPRQLALARAVLLG